MFLPSNITLKFGDSGDFVSELQRRLVAVSCFGAEGINGFFDGSTVNGVSQFQSMSGIRADGIAGPETLRRLNGVISGDTSSSDAQKAEEEARAQQENAMRHQMAQQQLYEQQQALLAQQQAAAAQAQAVAETYAPQPQAYQPLAQAPYQAEMSPAQAPVYQAQQQIIQQQQAPVTISAGDDVLARMLLGQAPAQQQQAQPAQPLQAAVPPPQHAPQPAAIPVYAAAPAPQYVPPQPATAQPVYAPQVSPQMPVTTSQATMDGNNQAAEPPPRGMVGRAVQFVSEKMQQLSNYFESKLPNHVLNEVKAIGLVMSQSGVKEASIPTGPEPQRGLEGPQRGQQQGQERS